MDWCGPRRSDSKDYFRKSKVKNALADANPASFSMKGNFR